MVMRMHLSIVTVNVHGLNATTERHRVAKMIQKQDLDMSSLQI